MAVLAKKKDLLPGERKPMQASVSEYHSYMCMHMHMHMCMHMSCM